MRKTWGQLVTTSQDYITDASTTTTGDTSDTTTILKTELNNGVQICYTALKKIKQTLKTHTDLTEEDVQYYPKPIDFGSFDSATVLIGSTYYPLTLITSSDRWNWLNAQSYSTQPPKYIYFDKSYFWIWPTPSEDDKTITLKHHYLARDLYADDYETGTADFTNGDATVAGTDTAWASTMADRWMYGYKLSGSRKDASTDMYQISSVTSTTALELTTTFADASLAGASYVMGESPSIPPELHHYLPHFSSGMFYSGPKRDKAEAQAHLNFFWTGDFNNNSRNKSDAMAGLLGYLRSYGATGEGNTGLVNWRSHTPNPFDERFRSGVITI